MPKGLNDRAQDCWRPLFAIADAIGGVWPGRAREAANQLSPMSDDDHGATGGVLLLRHIHQVFIAKQKTAIASKDLAEALNANEAWPWCECRHGRPISPRGIAKHLGRYGIKPHKTNTHNEYRKADFADAWSRYAPSTGAGPQISSTSSTALEHINHINGLKEPGRNERSSTGEPKVELEKTQEKPANTGSVEVVELKTEDSTGVYRNGHDANLGGDADDIIEVRL